MRTATIRDLRTKFPEVRRRLEQDGELIVTERGRPIIILRPYERQASPKPSPVDYYKRLRARMARPLSAATRRKLDEAERGER